MFIESSDPLLCVSQMTLLEGTVAVDGDFAYVAQQAWILNASFRDNILFGKEMEEERWVPNKRRVKRSWYTRSKLNDGDVEVKTAE